MKKRLIWIGLILFMATGVLFAQTTVSLDDAIKAGAEEIEGRLTRGVKVVVLNFRSPSARLSDYVIDEMMTALVRSGKVQVIDRANLELIRSEMNFQMSGDVSDTSAQRIGELLGAQSIVSGNIEDMGSHQRLRFRVIAVETAAVQAMTSHNVRNDAQMTNLMRGAARTQADTSSTLYPRGLNYSSGYKVGMGFLNGIFGLGSFIMGDIGGGFLIGGMQAAGIVFAFIAIIPEEGESYFVSTGPYGSGYWRQDYIYNDWAYIPAAGLYLGAVITSFVRPFAYDVRLAKKRGTYIGFDSNPMGNITFSPVFDKNGESRMTLLYSASY